MQIIIVLKQVVVPLPSLEPALRHGASPWYQKKHLHPQAWPSYVSQMRIQGPNSQKILLIQGMPPPHDGRGRRGRMDCFAELGPRLLDGSEAQRQECHRWRLYRGGCSCRRCRLVVGKVSGCVFCFSLPCRWLFDVLFGYVILGGLLLLFWWCSLRWWRWALCVQRLKR